MGNTCLNKNVRPLEIGPEMLHKSGDVYVSLKDECCADRSPGMLTALSYDNVVMEHSTI